MKLIATAAATLAIAALGTAHSENASATPQGLELSRHHVVISSTLPSCENDDGSGPFPCTWNVNPDDGNGRGAAYYIGGKGNLHYVWAHNPTHRASGEWEWAGNRIQRRFDIPRYSAFRRTSSHSIDFITPRKPTMGPRVP